MYVLAVPEVLDVPAKGRKYPPLVVSDYPTKLRRVLALYAYYRTWGARAFPFLDERVVPSVPADLQLPFVQFSNLYYHCAIQKVEKNIANIRSYAGRLDACYDCLKLRKCREICAHALPFIPRQGVDDNTYSRIHRVMLDAGAQKLKNVYSPEFPSYLVSFSSLLNSLPGRPRAGEVCDSDVGVGNVPSDQEEWWTE